MEYFNFILPVFEGNPDLSSNGTCELFPDEFPEFCKGCSSSISGLKVCRIFFSNHRRTFSLSYQYMQKLFDKRIPIFEILSIDCQFRSDSVRKTIAQKSVLSKVMAPESNFLLSVDLVTSQSIFLNEEITDEMTWQNRRKKSPIYSHYLRNTRETLQLKLSLYPSSMNPLKLIDLVIGQSKLG